MARRYTEDELEFIKNNPEMSAKELGLELGRTTKAIMEVRIKYGFRSTRPAYKKGESKYTPEQDKVIMLRTLTNAEKARELGISKDAVSGRKARIQYYLSN